MGLKLLAFLYKSLLHDVLFSCEILIVNNIFVSFFPTVTSKIQSLILSAVIAFLILPYSAIDSVEDAWLSAGLCRLNILTSSGRLIQFLQVFFSSLLLKPLFQHFIDCNIFISAVPVVFRKKIFCYESVLHRKPKYSSKIFLGRTYLSKNTISSQLNYCNIMNYLQTLLNFSNKVIEN